MSAMDASMTSKPLIVSMLFPPVFPALWRVEYRSTLLPCQAASRSDSLQEQGGTKHLVTESNDHSFRARARAVLAPVTAVFRSLRNRDFRIYILSGCPSLLTDWMTRVAVGWLAWELTHSAAWLGVLGF